MIVARSHDKMYAFSETFNLCIMQFMHYERKIIVGNEDQLSNEEFLLYVACIISVSINLRQQHCMNLSDD